MKAKRTKKPRKARRPKSVPMSKALGAYKGRYKVNKEKKTAGGSPTISKDDAVARALTGSSVDELKKVAAENGFADRYLGWEKAGHNPGQLRMNLGNVLRGMVRRGVQKVTIKGKAL